MDIKEAAISFIKRWSDFEGRSSRSEFWWAQLAYFIVYVAALVVFGIISAISDVLGYVAVAILFLALLASIVPSLAICVRRLHDTDKSGWWYLISFIPFGGIVLLVFFCTAGTKGTNKFGTDPLGGSAEEVFA